MLYCIVCCLPCTFSRRKGSCLRREDLRRRNSNWRDWLRPIWLSYELSLRGCLIPVTAYVPSVIFFIRSAVQRSSWKVFLGFSVVVSCHNLYGCHFYVSTRPDWQAMALGSPVVHSFVRLSVRLSVTNLVSTILWKRVNWFDASWHTVIHVPRAGNCRLWDQKVRDQGHVRMKIVLVVCQKHHLRPPLVQ